MKTINWLTIILLILLSYKLIDIKIETKCYQLENDIYDDITDIYKKMGTQTDLINQIK